MTMERIRTAWRGRWRRLPWVRNTLICIAPLFVVWLCQLITQQSGAEALEWMDSHTGALFLTYGLLFFAQSAILALTGRFFAAALAITVPTVLFAVANHLKEAVNGVPILASDLAMAGRAGEIAGFLRPGMDLGATTWQGLRLAGGLLLVSLIWSRGERRETWPRRLLACGLSVSLLCNTAWLPASSALLEGKENESQGSRNERLGLLAGMFSALRESAMEEPDAYSENNMNRILRELEEAAAGQAAGGERPNIVLIASESFFDVTRLPGVTFHEDPIPNFRRLTEECAGGRFLSSAYAGGTGNVEMELFTGIPSAFPGASESLTSLADQSAYSRMPSLVKTLEGQGYRSVLVHSYNDSLYSRAFTMPAIGFDETVYGKDFAVEPEYSGGYLSDLTLAEELIARFKDKGEEPIFLYGLSMENHQPYYGDKFTGPSGVDYTCDALEGEDLGVLDALIHGIHDADAALGRLTDYFADCGEPVLLVFFGDHMPGLCLDAGDTVYSRLGYASSSDTGDWEAEELRKMHQTDFLVWNNYGAELEVDAEVSVTHMAERLLDWAGLWKPLWFTWVERAGEDVKLYRERLFVDGAGQAHDAPTEESEETVSIYRALVYDMLYGEHFISEALTGYAPEGEG